jgi:hypothetical protein
MVEPVSVDSTVHEDPDQSKMNHAFLVSTAAAAKDLKGGSSQRLVGTQQLSEEPVVSLLRLRHG